MVNALTELRRDSQSLRPSPSIITSRLWFPLLVRPLVTHAISWHLSGCTFRSEDVVLPSQVYGEVEHLLCG